MNIIERYLQCFNQDPVELVLIRHINEDFPENSHNTFDEILEKYNWMKTKDIPQNELKLKDLHPFSKIMFSLQKKTALCLVLL